MSRQREFLADAASAQYTRDPIGARRRAEEDRRTRRRALASPARNAEQASHMFFGNGVGEHLFPWLGTHPPLAERIRRLDAAWDGTFPKVEPRPRPTRAAPEPAKSWLRAAREAAAASVARPLGAEAVVASVGNPTAAPRRLRRRAARPPARDAGRARARAGERARRGLRAAALARAAGGRRAAGGARRPRRRPAAARGGARGDARGQGLSTRGSTRAGRSRGAGAALDVATAVEGVRRPGDRAWSRPTSGSTSSSSRCGAC